MAGMRAGLIHPHFPFFVEGGRLWGALTANSDMNSSGIIDYESSASIKAFVQLLHRGMAYILTGAVIYLFLQIKKRDISSRLKKGNLVMLLSLIHI